MLRTSIALAMALPFMATADSSAPNNDPERPNVVLILSDDQAWNDYSFMGHAEIETPNLDQLAAESLTFTRGYSPVPLCCPALATIATGLYPHQHGVTGNDPKRPIDGVRPVAARSDARFSEYYEKFDTQFQRNPNLIRDLTSRGYATLQTGKWWHSNPIRTAGFTHAMTRGDIVNESRHGDMGLGIGRTGIGTIKYFVETESKGRPFFLWYAPYLPHAPHTPPQDLLDKYLKRTNSEAQARYWANVEWFDRTCGELLGYLDELGIRENTIVLYTCDNGWVQDLENINKFAPRSKRTPYEAGIRTPIMVSRPGVIEPRMDREHLASNIDLWPTLAAALGTETPSNLPGINLADTKKLTNRTDLYGEVFKHDISDFEHPQTDLLHRWTIQGDWKLIEPNPSNLPHENAELFNIKEDPYELVDLAKEHPKLLEELRRKLNKWWTPSDS